MPKMGTSLAAETGLQPAGGLGDALFTSTQQRVLGFLFGQPERSFFANELIRLAGAGSGAVQRELRQLADSGLVVVSTLGNQKHYRANPDAPIFEELCGIVRKTFGLAYPLREALLPFSDRIDAAFVFGSIAKKSDTAVSDIDLMLISDSLSYGELFTALDQVSVRLGRTLNPTVFTAKELRRKLQSGESFIKRVMAQPKLWILGDADVLAA